MSLSSTMQGIDRLTTTQVHATNWHILRTLLSLVSAALLLRVGGMLNQVVISARFGAGASMDAYFVAAAFPLLLVQLIGSAIEAAVIPVYSQLRARASKEDIARLVSTLLNCLVLSALPLVGLLLVLRQPLVLLTAPGLKAAQIAQAVALAPLLYLAIPFSLLLGFLECILNAEGQFGWPAYAGLLVPLTTALLAWLGGRTYGVFVLCIGSLLGTALQLVVVVVRARQACLRYRLTLDLQNVHFRTILRAAWPVLLGAFISQGSPLVDQIFASTLPVGSISALHYALKLISIFSGVLFVSVGRALLPCLARQAGLHDPSYRGLKRTLRLYFWSLGLCTLALSVILFFLASPLVQLLFQRGAFSATEAQSASATLRDFLPGLTPMAVCFLSVRAFSALGETRVPMQIAFVSVGANAFLDALCSHFWQAQGIALATSLVYLISSVLLLTLLRRRIGTLQICRLPDEFRAFYWRARGIRECGRFAWLKYHLRVTYSDLQQYLLFAGIAVLVLAAGVITTAYNALLALRATSGMFITLCLLRYPFLLLLAWASLNVGIGSTIPLFNGNNLDLILILPLLLWLAFLPWRRIARRLPGLVWQLLYLAWILLGFGFSPLDARAFFTRWLTMLAYPAVSLLAIGLLTTRRRLLGLIDTLLITALLVSLYGLYGFLTHQQGEIDPGTHLFRITSLFTQATTFAFYLSLVVPLALYRSIYARGVWRLACGLLTLCLLATLLLTFTRGAYASVCMEMLLMALCQPIRRARSWVVGGLLILCGLTIALGGSGQVPFLARFFSGDMATLNGRTYLWQALLSRFQVTQWFGNGLQASDSVLSHLRVGNYGQGVIGTAPHNLYLGTLYDHGVAGLLLLIGVFLSLGRGLLRGIHRSSGERRMLHAVALAALVGLLLQSFVSRDIWIQQIGIPFWLIAALPFALCWSPVEAGEEIQAMHIKKGFNPGQRSGQAPEAISYRSR